MLVTTARIGFIAIALLAAGLTKSDAAQVGGPFMAVTGPTSQPIGHFEFCEQRPRECAVRTERPALVRLDAARWRELVAINARVNTVVAPVTDEDLFGKPEVWFYPTDRGDCEDYVLLKQRQLLAAGWPASALLITVVRQSDGEGHAVLTVRTDRGDMVLDNLEAEIRPWNETSYLYVKRQSDRDSGRWVGIADDRGMMVGAIGR